MRIGCGIKTGQVQNTSRRTSRTDTGNGGALSDASRAQDGVTFIGSASLSKPVFNNGRMLSQISLKTGASHDTVTSTTRPLVGISLQNNWILSPETTVYVAPFFEHTWSSGKRLFNETGVRAGATYRLNQSTILSLDSNISHRNFADDARDGNFIYAKAGISHTLDTKNKLQFDASFANNSADNDFYNVSNYSLGLEWRHLFDNGFITSLGGRVGERRYDRLAPLTTEVRKDKFMSGTIGLSHQKLSFKGIRPELTYTYTKQTSNDLFNDFDAHDFGVRFKIQTKIE